MNKYVFVLVVVLVGLGIALVSERANRQRPAVEDPAQRRQDIVDAFQNPPPDGDDPKQFEAFLQELEATIKAGNGDTIGALFDFERMYDECNRNGVLAKQGLRRTQFVGQLRAGIVQQFGQNQILFQWDASQVRSVRWLVPQREAVVIARHWEKNDPELGSKMRWWLKWNGQRWQLFDFEDLDAGVRMSVAFGSILNEIMGRNPNMAEIQAIGQAGQVLRDAAALLIGGELDAAEAELRKIQLTKLPRIIDGMRHFFWAAIHAGRHQPQEALRELNLAESLHPDMPIKFSVRASIYSQLEDYDKVIENGLLYIELLGNDPTVCNLMGEAYEKLQQPEKAADSFLRALEETPRFPDATAGLRRVAVAAGGAKLAERLRRLRDPSSAFNAVFHEVLEEKDFAGAQALLDALRALKPDSFELPSAEVRLRLKSDKLQEAIAWFRSALPKIDDAEQRNRLFNAFLYGMADEGKLLEAYQAVPDADASRGFTMLAEMLIDEDDEEGPAAAKGTEKLKLLIEAHRKREPQDVWLHFFAGQTHFLNKDYDAAEREYAAGMDRTGHPKDFLDRCRGARVYARHAAGKGLSAYKDIGPRGKTFTQLGYLFNKPENAGELQQLVDLHRKAEPKDGVLPAWQGEVYWLRHEYEKAIAEYRRFVPPNPKEGEYVEGIPWAWREHLCRSLARLGRIAEARQEAEQISNFPLLKAALTAASGDVAATERELAELVKLGYGAANFYFDADLAAALRGDKFRALREKYPEPKDERPVKKL